MNKEIERKFLVKKSHWADNISKQIAIKQGYLSDDLKRIVRIRTYDDNGVITIKGEAVGISKKEFEYTIPYHDAIELLSMCKEPLIEKTRYLVYEDSFKWEIDVFEGENEGLQVAEIELKTENQSIPLPSWVGIEVTHDMRYQNSNLRLHPYRKWIKKRST